MTKILSTLLYLRFDREHSHETDAESLPETSVGVNGQNLLLTIDQSMPGNLLTAQVVASQFQAESDLINFPVETVAIRFAISSDSNTTSISVF